MFKFKGIERFIRMKQALHYKEFQEDNIGINQVIMTEDKNPN